VIAKTSKGHKQSYSSARTVASGFKRKLISCLDFAISTFCRYFTAHLLYNLCSTSLFSARRVQDFGLRGVRGDRVGAVWTLCDAGWYWPSDVLVSIKKHLIFYSCVRNAETEPVSATTASALLLNTSLAHWTAQVQCDVHFLQNALGSVSREKVSFLSACIRDLTACNSHAHSFTQCWLIFVS